MSLQAVSNSTGLSVPTLSKIENGVVELSYTRMIAISEAIGINLTELVASSQPDARPATVTARRSVTLSGTSVIIETENYIYEYLSTDISKKRMIPAYATVKARSLAEFGDLYAHSGEEFVTVMEGEIELHTEHYEPVVLSEGDSAYIDSTMGHAMITTSQKLARILSVCTHAIQDKPHIEAATKGHRAPTGADEHEQHTAHSREKLSV